MVLVEIYHHSGQKPSILCHVQIFDLGLCSTVFVIVMVVLVEMVSECILVSDDITCGLQYNLIL